MWRPPLEAVILPHDNSVLIIMERDWSVVNVEPKHVVIVYYRNKLCKHTLERQLVSPKKEP